MAISFTYTTLRAALEDWMEDGFADFTDQLDNIIALAELRCVRDLDLDLFNQVDGSTTTTAETTTIPMPSGGIVVKQLWVNGVFCQPREEGYVYWYDDLTADGQPLYWCQVTESAIKIAPRPDAAYSCRIIYMRRPTGLSSSTSTTFISNYAGDLLFAACKAQAEMFDKAPEDAAANEAEYQRLLPLARRELRMIARKEYP